MHWKTATDRLVGAMADTGQRQRPLQLDPDRPGTRELSGPRRVLQKAPRNPHRSHRMRTGWTKADAKEIQDRQHKGGSGAQVVAFEING